MQVLLQGIVEKWTNTLKDSGESLRQQPSLLAPRLAFGPFPRRSGRLAETGRQGQTSLRSKHFHSVPQQIIKGV